MTTQLTPAHLQRMKDDYSYFTRCLWRELDLDSKAPLGWPELDMLDFIQHGGPKIEVLSFRGVGKTTFGTASYTCWELFRDADRRVMVLSKTTKKAREFIAMIRQWIGRVWFLNHLEPDPTKDHRDNTDAFDVGPQKDKDKDPSVSAYGIDGQLPGSRAHIIIGDDVETLENTRTIGGRELLSEKVKEFEAIVYKGDPTTRIIFFGTYHHEESLYLKLEPRGFVIRTWPLCVPANGEHQKGLAPEVRRRIEAGDYRADGCLFAHRISEDEVVSARAQGRRFFAMQFQLVADLGDTMRYPLRLDDLIVPTFAIDRDMAPLWVAYGRSTANGVSTRRSDLPNDGFTGDGLYHEIAYAPERAPYEKTVAWVDPSGRGADRTSLTIIGMLAGFLYVKFCGAVSLPGESGGSDAVMARIAGLLRQHGAHDCGVEAQIGGDQDLYAKLLTTHVQRASVARGHPLYPAGWTCSVTADPTWARGQKELRIIEALDPVMAAHRLVVSADALDMPEGVPVEHTLQRQLTRLTREKGCLTHDDVVEGLAACVRRITVSMHGDPAVLAHRKKQDMLRRTLEEMGAIAKKTTRLWTHRHHQDPESFPHAPRRG